MPTGYTTVSGSRLQDSSGNLITNATIYFLPVDNKGYSRSYKSGDGSGGQVVSASVSTNVANGVFSIQVADTTLTKPVNIGYSVTVIDNVTGESLLGPGYTCVQPTGDTWNFDAYEPNLAGQITVQYGPPGATGATGAQGQQGLPGTLIVNSGITSDILATNEVTHQQIGILIDQVLSYSQQSLALNTYTLPGNIPAYKAGPPYGFFFSDYGLTATQMPGLFTSAELGAVLDAGYSGVQPGTGWLPIAYSTEWDFYNGITDRRGLPCADGQFFIPLLEWIVYSKTGDIAHFNANKAKLETSLALLPVDGATGLLQITSEVDWIPWLFQEIQVDRGDVLIPSLMYARVCSVMAKLYTAAEDATNSERWLTAMNKIIASLNATSSSLWDSASGLYLHATEQNNLPDILGSALAVYISVVEQIPVASSVQIESISNFLNTRYAARFTDTYPIFKEGYCVYIYNPATQHTWNVMDVGSTGLPTGVGQYQNGGYWCVGNKWIQVAMAQTSPETAMQYALDHISRSDPHLEYFDAYDTGQGGSPNLESVMGTSSYLLDNFLAASGSAVWQNALIRAGGSEGIGLSNPNQFNGTAITGENVHRLWRQNDVNRYLDGVLGTWLERTTYNPLTGVQWLRRTDVTDTPAESLYYLSSFGATPELVVQQTPAGITASGAVLVKGNLRVAGSGSSDHFIGQVIAGGDTACVATGELSGVATIGGNNSAITEWTDLAINPLGSGAKTLIGSIGGTTGVALTIDNATGRTSINGGVFNIPAGYAPASATAPGTPGDIRFDGAYLYYCTGTNSWVRTAMTSW